MNEPTQAWKRALAEKGYAFHCRSPQEFRKASRLGRVWKTIFRVTGMLPPAKVFELGCGGGVHMAKLAVRGFEVVGLDVSHEVLARAEVFFDEVRQFHPINVRTVCADFFAYAACESFNLCYHVGVVEHFLERADRMHVWGRLYRQTKPGGWVVSIVPCGAHLMRAMVREKGLAGYHIPEIDYTCKLHFDEYQEAGLVNIQVIPHNYFAFLSSHPSFWISRIAYPPLFAMGNFALPHTPLPNALKERFAHGLIALGQKPLN